MEDFAGLAIHGGEAVQQAGTDGGSHSNFTGAEGRGMDDVAIGIVGSFAAVEGWLSGGVGSNLNDAVVGAVFRSGEGGTNAHGLLAVPLRLVLILGRGRLAVGRMGGGGLGQRSGRRRGNGRRGGCRRIAGDDGVVGRRIRDSLIGIGGAGLLCRRNCGRGGHGSNEQSADKKGTIHETLQFRVVLTFGCPLCRNRDLPSETNPWLVRHCSRQRVAQRLAN